MAKVTIYHNPRCSKSRQTLELLRKQGIEPEVIEYLQTPPDANTLKEILQQLGIPARQLLRIGEPEYTENKLDNKTLSDNDIIAVMVEHPKLIQRPIVLTNGKAVLGRPPANVLKIL